MTSLRKPMTPLRKRMIEDLQLQGMSQRTQQMYARAVQQLAQYSHKSPDLIDDEELRQSFLHVKNDKNWSRSASTVALCGLTFFYEHTLKNPWPTLRFIRAPKEKKLPVILSVEEVRTILDCLRLPRYRVCLNTLYSCGLRLSEGTSLPVTDIDSSRMKIHVRPGKGGKDRLVPLPPSTLQLLRQYWVTHELYGGFAPYEFLIRSASQPMATASPCNL